MLEIISILGWLFAGLALAKKTWQVVLFAIIGIVLMIAFI